MSGLLQLKIYPSTLWRRHVGAEVLREAFGVSFEERAHALRVLASDDEADVVGLVNAEDYLHVGVSRSVGVLLPRERERDAAVLAARFEFADALAARVRDLDARPLAPEVVAGSGFEGLGDESAADARGDFEEVELAVRRAAYELGVRRAAFESERGEQFLVEPHEFRVLARVVLDRARGEDAAVVRDVQRRTTVAARAAEDYLAAFDD